MMKTHQRCGVGFCELLAVVFIALKLSHNIDWSWWWVLSPLWLPFAVGFVLLFVASLFDAYLMKTDPVYRAKKNAKKVMDNITSKSEE